MLDMERKPVLLFVDYAVSQQDLSAGSRSNFRYFKKLIKMGLEVKFLAGDFQRVEPFSTGLNQLGIETMDGEWYRQNWETWLGDTGPGIDYVFFNKPDLAATFLAAVRSHTKAATLYRCHELRNRRTISAEENFILANSDVILTFNEDEEALIKEEFPHKKVLPEPLFDRTRGDEQLSIAMTGILSACKKEASLRLAKAIGDATQQKPVRLFAFYLPQYHPIPENDEWWGEGFTEWHNVSKAQPLFPGHYQPHVPADLGYYDLRQKETRNAQANLAKKYGIEGFCYYHYWFKGKRLLERPLEELIKSGKPDFPFCICWANESWSRRWDGKDQDILMKQEYSETDDRQHIRSLLPVFADKRYIRVNGKPLFLVYRTESIPDPARTAEIWREEARKAGIGELYLCRIESFEKSDPGEINFDAAVEFAPDWWNKGPQLKADSELLGRAVSDLTEVCDNNYIHSYQGLAEAMMAKVTPGYKWFRCVTPCWDNWARRNEKASVFLDSTPHKYQAWLSRCVDQTNARLLGEERIVFVNAWNEWAEGNHLEPDQKFGHAYLEATKQALEDGQLATNVRRVKASDEAKVNSLRVNRLMNQLDSKKYQLKELEQEMKDLLSSTSWRMTAPVRWMKQQLLDLKKHFSK